MHRSQGQLLTPRRALLVYSVIQIDQIRDALQAAGSGAFTLDSGDNLAVRACLIAIPCAIGFCVTVLLYFTWRLYLEFGWSIYKHIGADLRMRRRFMVYQILVALLKFDFIFFLGFSIQFAVINLDVKDPEFSLTIAAIPITVLGLVFTAWALRHEKMWGMLVSCIFFLAGLSYFLFKLIRLYSGAKAADYSNSARRPLATFAVITLCLLFATLANGALCVHNFNHGLKHHVLRRTGGQMTKSGSKTNGVGDVEAFEMPTRAALDDGEGSEASPRRSGLASAGAAMSTSSTRPYTAKSGLGVSTRPVYPTDHRRRDDDTSEDDDDDDDDDFYDHTGHTADEDQFGFEATYYEDAPKPFAQHGVGGEARDSMTASEVEAMDIADYYAYGQRSAVTSMYGPPEYPHGVHQEPRSAFAGQDLTTQLAPQTATHGAGQQPEQRNERSDQWHDAAAVVQRSMTLADRHRSGGFARR